MPRLDPIRRDGGLIFPRLKSRGPIEAYSPRAREREASSAFHGLRAVAPLLPFDSKYKDSVMSRKSRRFVPSVGGLESRALLSTIPPDPIDPIKPVPPDPRPAPYPESPPYPDPAPVPAPGPVDPAK